MDGPRFDDLAQSFSTLGSRRAALRALAGAALAAVAGRPAAAAAGERRDCPKRRCRKPGYARNPRTCRCECERRRCSGGKEFDPGSCRCRCPSGMRECNDTCVPRDGCCPGDPPCPEDPKGCCHAPGLEVCTIDGCCIQIDGKKACNGFCVDTTVSRHHCGECGAACGPGEVCEGGACRPGCEPGQEPCGGGCVAAGTCCSGTHVCPAPYTQCCPGAHLGDPGGCCLPQSYCIVGPQGISICSPVP